MTKKETGLEDKGDQLCSIYQREEEEEEEGHQAVSCMEGEGWQWICLEMPGNGHPIPVSTDPDSGPTKRRTRMMMVLLENFLQQESMEEKQVLLEMLEKEE